MKNLSIVLSIVLSAVLFTFSCADENSKGRTFSGKSGGTTTGTGGSGGSGGGGSGGSGGANATIDSDPVFIATIDGNVIEFNADNATGGSPVSISGDEYIFRTYF